MAMEVDATKVIQAARSHVPLTVKTFTLPHETEIYLEEILAIFLKELGQETLRDPLAYCLKELAVNAKKANTKRIYFSEKRLDLHDETDYLKGMANFKSETLDNIDHYLKLQKEAGYYIKVTFQTHDSILNVSVANNTEITRKEQIRVYDRIARSRAFGSLEEALSAVLDDSEGAGLGIVILVLMLKKLGLDEDAFDIDIENGETVARLTIPMSSVRMENVAALSNEIVNQIDSLPKFPENIVFLQQLIANPESDFQEIARQIATDPALTADLLKIVNSAQFMLAKKVDNIFEAVKMVGLRGLRNLLYSYGSMKVLGGLDDAAQKQLWSHSYRTAFYAYYTTKNLSKKREILDDVYVGGILHDMGKIVFSAVHPNLMEKIQRFCHEKMIPSDLFEDMTSGLNHSEIGAMVAEKWLFPDALVSSIKYHHLPSACPKQHRDVAEAVYLANAMCHYENGDITFDQIDREILSSALVQTEDQLKRVLEKLSAAFEKEK